MRRLKPVLRTIASQPSFMLNTKSVQAAVTKRAGMLAPVTFYRDTDKPVQPYSISPWAKERLAPETPHIIAILRGDFMCSAFGANTEPFEGKQFPVHGETANEVWRNAGLESTKKSQILRLAMDLKIRGGRCQMLTALVEGHNVVYQRHDFCGVDGPLNPGHHATLRFPDREGAGRLSFSRFAHAHTFIHPMENPAEKGYSFLKPNTPVSDLTAVPCVDGSITDVTRYPARRGFEDVLILCADPSLELAWSAVTFFEEGYVWFSLRDPGKIVSTQLWISNGGRHYAPWNGRHVNVMGIEEMTGFFHLGLAASARDNLLTQKGFKTCHRLKPSETLRIPYVQGVARVPRGFDHVASIEIESGDSIRLVADSGISQVVPCYAEFAKTGELDLP